jgi:hypothetical protein
MQCAKEEEMSKVTVTYRVCDGCRRNERDDDIEIVKSRSRSQLADFDMGTIDICNQCEDADHYICQYCRGVHSDDNPCEMVAASQLGTDGGPGWWERPEEETN